jgi:hypothetical protein
MTASKLSAFLLTSNSPGVLRLPQDISHFLSACTVLRHNNLVIRGSSVDTKGKVVSNDHNFTVGRTGGSLTCVPFRSRQCTLLGHFKAEFELIAWCGKDQCGSSTEWQRAMMMRDEATGRWCQQKKEVVIS